MDPGSGFLIFLIFAAIVGVSFFLSYLRRQAMKALTVNVLDRGGHARGQAVVKEHLEFFVPASPATIVDEVLATLGLPRVPGGFVAQVYVASAEPGLVVFAFGNKPVPQSFRTALAIEELPDGSSHLEYTVLNWVESDGIVRAIAELDLLANSIRSCVSRLGGSPVAIPASSTAAPALEDLPTSSTPAVVALADEPVPAHIREPDIEAAIAPVIEPAPAPGIEAQEPPAIAAFCSQCGTPSLGSKFCTQCGHALARV